MTTTTASARVEILLTQLGYLKLALETNLAGVDHDESLTQPPGGGNCLNWVLGHLVASRDITLELLGRDPTWGPEKAARYARGSEPVTGPEEAVVPLEEILTDLETSRQAIVEGLHAISDEELDVLVPWFGRDEPKSVALAGLVFHESYHVGQTGVLRRLTGREGAIR